MNRKENLHNVKTRTTPYDVIVVGGGATGLGVAVDASTRGYETLLIEQADFAKGTSSKSTKLVHGGVRYLKQGNLSLVLEALKERGLLLQNAPHLVRDLEFIIPSYNWYQKPFYGIGMKVYDAMSGRKSFGSSKTLSLAETQKRLPTIQTEGLRGGVLYHDGQFDDARLAVNLAQTACEAGGTVLNYVRCTGLIKDGKHICGVLAVDEESGDELEIKGKSVVNATGVYVDDLLEYDSGEKSSMVAVSQGVHIVLPKKFLPGDNALMVPETDDGRVLFAIPWHDCVVTGTTDTPLKNKTLEPRALEEERNFVMTHARKYLAEQPTEDDVLSVYAGLRPLVSTKNTKSTSKLSRDHTILVAPSGLVTVTGGKWTTYRRMGKDVIDKVETSAGFTPRDCQTEDLKIHGYSAPEFEIGHMYVYGADRKALNTLLDSETDYRTPIHPSLPFFKGEVVWQVRHEMARTVEDVLARRTSSLLTNAAASIEACTVVADIMAAELEKDEQWKQQQVEAYTNIARGYVFMDPASTAAP